MAAKIGGGAGINLPMLLRVLADSIENSNQTMAAHLKPLRSGEWRNLGFTYMVRDNPEGTVRKQDIFIDVMSDTMADFQEDVVESEGQARHGAGQETP